MTTQALPVTTCSHCEKPPHLCVCDALAPVEHKTFVLILRHPQEQDRVLGTARIAERQLKNVMLKTGLSWPNLTRILGRPADPKRWGVLYLGTAKTTVPLPSHPLTVINKKGAPKDNQKEVLKNLEGIILLDGNWAQAKALWWRNAWLLKCQRLILQAPKPSLYGNLRKEPRCEGVSTIEAIAYTLSTLESRDDMAEKILAPFRHFLDKVRHARKSVEDSS